MAGPWEKYAAPAATGKKPWEQYAAAAPAAPKDNSAARAVALGAVKPVDNLRSAIRQIPLVGDALEYVRTNVAGRQTTEASVAANDAARANNTRTGYQLLGNIIGTAPTAALPGGTLLQGAVGGALLSDAKDAQGVATDAALGGIGGKVGEKVVRGLGTAVAPKLADTAQRLVDKGIPLTIGQIGRAAGGRIGNAVAFLEDAAANTLPFVGTFINEAREKGIKAFNRAVANDVLKPLGLAVPDAVEPGHATVKFAKDAFNKAYNDTLGQMRVQTGPALDARFAGALQAAETVPGDAVKTVQGVINDLILKRADKQTGELTGEQMKLAVRDLRAKAKALRGDGSGELAGLIDDVRMSLVEQASADSGKGLGKRLAKIDDAYGNFVVLRDAASKPVDGVFTPNQLNTAVRVADKSKGKGAKATGNARLQDLSMDASAVLPSSIGDSGTGARLTLSALAGGAGVANPAALLPILGTGAAASIPYTRAGQKVLGAVFAPGAKRAAVRNAANRLAIPVGVASPALIAEARK